MIQEEEGIIRVDSPPPSYAAPAEELQQPPKKQDTAPQIIELQWCGSIGRHSPSAICWTPTIYNSHRNKIDTAPNIIPTDSNNAMMYVVDHHDEATYRQKKNYEAAVSGGDDWIGVRLIEKC